MKKLILLTLFVGILGNLITLSQPNPRMQNPNYVQTKLYDDFNTGQLNRNTWNVSAHAIREDKLDTELFIWVDSSATVNQTNGDLKLSMLYYNDYTTTDYSTPPNIITADYIAGEVSSYEKFSYGIYESNATFSKQRGSFPAFWIMSAEDCGNSINNEIDIVELKYEFNDNPTFNVV
jgi:beta-glucanase (GH16 family)